MLDYFTPETQMKHRRHANKLATLIINEFTLYSVPNVYSVHYLEQFHLPDVEA